ncbi:AAA family ATPase [Archangium minus]|uniref:histidine kinase n=1 Tax=Archangium minus TaxID=83450 RepID=A0ABY9WMY9_9BACT|nr:AAA family ATPase [Archangium minus]
MAHWPGYALHQTLHESSRSTIIRATRIKDGCPVVLKLPPSDSVERRRDLELHREYAITRRVEGEGILRALGLEELPGARVALVLEDFGGTSMRHLLDERGPLDVNTFLDFASCISAALGHIHGQRVIHKDIKPHNLIVNPSTGVVKIADFSLSSSLSLETATPESPSRLVGSLAYMAPEQTGRMNRGVDYRADFHALGATFFEMLTGQRAFPANTPLELLHSHLAQLPPSPRDLVPDLPEPLAGLVLKLLSKDPDARYQSTRGLIADLDECRRQLRERGRINPFPLGTADRTHAFRLPQGLYGRATDVSALMDAYARAAAGRHQLLLVTGSAGIGKSSLVNELHRASASSKGRFAAGKCDQLHRDIPFDAVQQALRQLVHQTQAEGDGASVEVRQRLLGGVGGNAPVLAETVPEMRPLLGEQPPSLPLPPDQSKNRLIQTLLRALQAFATPGRPLCLFLDDLQWADGGTLSLVQALAHDPKDIPLLLVGAYRDAEVSKTHPLTLALDELRTTGTPLTRLHLSPLGATEVARMVGEATAVAAEQALELGQFIHSRTRGNPFAIKEFLRFLHEKGLLHFDTRSGQWGWDLERLKAADIPDDVADLMAQELQQLPGDTRALLQVAACLGVAFKFRELSVAWGAPATKTARALWSPIARGLVVPLSRDYLLLDPQGAGVPEELEVPLRFLHDKVRQAAYARIPQDERAQCHVRTGLRLLEDARARGTLEERMLSILPHLGQAPHLIASASLRLELADLHLKAGRRAKSSGAYRMACELFRTGGVLLPPDAWESEHERAFALQMELAETSYLAGEFDEAQSLFSVLIAQARTPEQRAGVYSMQATLMALSGQHERALESGLAGLHLLGLELPRSPTRMMIAAEFQAVAAQLGGRHAADLLDLPWTQEPGMQLATTLLANMLTAAYQRDQGLYALLVVRGVRLSLEHGNSRFSAFAYVGYGALLVTVFDDPQTGWEFGQLATELARRLQDPLLHARVRWGCSNVIDHWTHSVHAANAALNEALVSSLELGDWFMAGQCMNTQLWRSYSIGIPLVEIQKMSLRAMELHRKARNKAFFSTCSFLHRWVQMLLGSETQEPTDEFEQEPENQTQMERMSRHVVRAEQHYLLGQTEQALDEAEKAVQFQSSHSGFFRRTTHAFFHALSTAAVFPGASDAKKQELLTVMEQHRAFLEKCARRVPENFAPYLLLVSAEIARVKGQESVAVTGEYERAIAAARTSGFLNVEAMSNESAFRFHAEQGHRTKALAYLVDALDAYERWGAYTKVRMLAAEQASLLGAWSNSLRRWSARAQPATPAQRGSGVEWPAASSSSPSSSESLSEGLDMDSVLKASQVISSELLLPQLLGTLIQIAMESAGAQRGALVLKRGEDFIVEAVGEVGNINGLQHPAQPLVQSRALCLAVAQQVMRTGTHVLLDDSCSEEAFLADPYIQDRNIRSLLCVPILHRQVVAGLFYLENNLTPSAFNTSRLKVLGMLSAQAAISIENALLYRKLEEHSHTLEQRVHERTDELHQKNAKLRSTLEFLESMQQRIISQEKLASLGALTAGIAHELRNPLNFVNNFSELSLELLRELHETLSAPQASPEQRESLRSALEELVQNASKIREHGLRASNIIDGMLRHARNQRGEAQLLHLRPLVEEVIRFVHHDLQTKGPPVQVPIETSFDPSTPPLLLVPEDMRRVILNLVDNACYAAHKKAQRLGPSARPQVKVSTCCMEDSVELRVRDNGDGVPKRDRDRIFSPFFTTKPPGEGTGLGLSISHDIVLSLGGELRLESEEGLFAEFIVSLPRSAPRQQVD